MARVLPTVCLLLLASAARAESDPRCGAFCLYVALKAVDVPPDSLAGLERRLGPPGKAGYSLGQLQDAAQSYGAHTLPVKTSLQRLGWREKPFAVIAHLDGTHFVNLTLHEPGRVGIIDAPRSSQVSAEAFHARWPGEALLVSNRPLLPEEEMREPINWLRLLGWSALGIGGVGLVIGLLRWRRSALAVALLPVLMISGCAEPPQPSATGRLRLLSRDIDLGAISLTNAGEVRTIPVENVGAGPLHIIDLKTSCSCAIPKLPPGKLEPGKSGEFQVHIRPTKGGAGSTPLTLLTDDPLNPKVTLTLRWEAVAPVAVEPESVHFGELRPGGSAEFAIQLVNGGVGCTPGAPQIHPAANLQAELSAGDSGWTLLVRVQADRALQDNHGTIRIPLEGCDAPELRIPVHWNVREAVSAIPPRVFLGTAAPGAVVERTLRLVSAEGEVVITGIQVQDLAAATGEAVYSESGREVRVRWTAPAEPGIYSGEALVECSSPAAITIAVPVSGVVQASSNPAPIETSKKPSPPVALPEGEGSQRIGSQPASR